MAKTTVACKRCEKPFEKENKEINRAAKLRREHFCSLTCAAVHSNEPKRARALSKICSVCQRAFSSSTKARAASFCSHSCATRGSETTARAAGRKKGGEISSGNLLPTHDVLRRREAPKYHELSCALGARPHQFEFPLEGFIFDLALLNEGLLVEFDGRYHKNKGQQETDLEKNAVAERRGFRLLRIPVLTGAVIPASVLNQIR